MDVNEAVTRVNDLFPLVGSRCDVNLVIDVDVIATGLDDQPVDGDWLLKEDFDPNVGLVD